MQVSYQRLHKMNPIQARRMIIETYPRCASISATAREMETSRQVVRKWVQRYELEGEKGLSDRSRCPHISPRKTPSKIERLVRKLRKKTGCGRRRLAWILRRDYNICISEDTVRHILRRLGTKSKRKPRRRFYPAHWVWEVKEPFFHPTRTEVRAGTPIFCPEGAKGGLKTDSGEEQRAPWGKKLPQRVFGGKSPRTLEELQKTLYKPWNAQLARIPLGRKGYNGRVERSHLTDDQEFYLPCILSWKDTDDLLRMAEAWQHVYNVKRPHFGKGMGGLSPLVPLRGINQTPITRIQSPR